MSSNTTILDFMIEEYDEAATIRALVRVFGGEESFSHDIVNRSDWDREVAGGLTQGAFNELFDKLYFDSVGNWLYFDQLKNSLWPPHSAGTHISKTATVVTVRIAVIYVMLRDILMDGTMAVRFLVSRHPELEAGTPIEAAFSSAGEQQVLEIIASGLHGLPAWTLPEDASPSVAVMREDYPRASRLFATKTLSPTQRGIVVKNEPSITDDDREAADTIPVIEVRLDILERSLCGFRDTGTWDDYFPPVTPGGIGIDIDMAEPLGKSTYRVDTDDEEED